VDIFDSDGVLLKNKQGREAFYFFENLKTKPDGDPEAWSS